MPSQSQPSNDTKLPLLDLLFFFSSVIIDTLDNVIVNTAFTASKREMLVKLGYIHMLCS